jgi:hypothetical protein
MSNAELKDAELKALDRLANLTIGYLVIISLGSFFAGVCVVADSQLVQSVRMALFGLSGSAIAALTSCLDRYAIGFERENGKPYPKGAKHGEEKFNRRFSRWLFVRPFLGAIVAPIFVWGLSHFAKEPKEFLGSTELIGFTAFMGGLLAKSVVDLIRNLFKNVFRA